MDLFRAAAAAIDVRSTQASVGKEIFVAAVCPGMCKSTRWPSCSSWQALFSAGLLETQDQRVFLPKISPSLRVCWFVQPL